jgi:hypothetical protein
MSVTWLVASAEAIGSEGRAAARDAAGGTPSVLRSLSRRTCSQPLSSNGSTYCG